MKTLALLALLLFASQSSAAERERVVRSEDGRGFVLSESKTPFTPWGFNYDHDGDGRLLEDYWDAEWSRVEADFREMRALGANVVRIHLQFGRFMDGPTKPRPSSLDQLTRLLRLAEETGLYLDLTGLGCYHKADVPAWYDALSEQERWQAQAAFWSAVARTCAASPAVFCYDLMNEPVVAGGDTPREDWLGPAFGGKHFVQVITRDRAGRERPEIARQWIRTLVAAVRQHDPRRLVTVGLVDWSLDKPGLTSGFVPTKIADELDFLAVHIYPQSGKLDEALETLRGFAAAGKPVIIEETFPLKCKPEELGRFITDSRDHAAGWIGFYWGQSPDELRQAGTFPAAMTLAWLELFQKLTPQISGSPSQTESPLQSVTCEGAYTHHLQGVCVDDAAIYWSFTTTLVKTDRQGRLLKSIPVANHHGDLCQQAGRLYVAVNLGKFNDPQGNADSWVYVYDADTLTELARHATPEVFHGAGGIGLRDGRFFVVGGLPNGVEENYVYEYDPEFRFVKRHVLRSGHTHLGIQTATFAHDRWWFGCYGDPKILLVADADFRMQGRFEFDCSLGIERLPDGRLLVASGRRESEQGHIGQVRLAIPDEKRGLKLLDLPAGALR